MMMLWPKKIEYSHDRHPSFEIESFILSRSIGLPVTPKGSICGEADDKKNRAHNLP